MIIDLYGTSMGLGLTSSTFATKLDEVGLKLTIAYLFFGEDMVEIKDRKETRNQRSFTFGIQHPDLVAVLDANFLTHRELMPCGCGCNKWLIQPWIHSPNTSTIRWLRCLMRTFTLPSIAKCNCWMCENLIFTLNNILLWNVLDAIYRAHSTGKLGKVWVPAISMCHGTLSCYMFSVSLRKTIFLRTFVRTVPGSTTAWPPLELRNSHARGAETSMESVIK